MRRLLGAILIALVSLALGAQFANADTGTPSGFQVSVGKMYCSLDMLAFDWNILNQSDASPTFGIFVNDRQVNDDAGHLSGLRQSGQEFDGWSMPFRVKAGDSYTVSVRADGVTYAQTSGVAPKCSWGHQIRVTQPRCIRGKPVVEWQAVNGQKNSEYVSVITAWDLGNHFGRILPYTTQQPGDSLRGTANLGKWLSPGQGFMIFKSRDGQGDGKPVVGVVPDCSGRKVRYPEMIWPPMLQGLNSLHPNPGFPLTANIGEWKPTPTASSIQWFRQREFPDGHLGNFKAIPGATTGTYVPTEADVNYVIGFKVTVKSPGRSTASAYSYHYGTPLIYPPD